MSAIAFWQMSSRGEACVAPIGTAASFGDPAPVVRRQFGVESIQRIRVHLSSMARRRNVDTIRGTGRILADDRADVLLAQVGYVIIVQEEVLDPPSGPGRRSARGYLVHDHFNPDVAMALVGRPVDLELSDGRRWPCLVDDAEGALEGRGAFKPPLPSQ
jgi:hypothetical protein